MLNRMIQNLHLPGFVFITRVECASLIKDEGCGSAWVLKQTNWQRAERVRELTTNPGYPGTQNRRSPQFL